MTRFVLSFIMLLYMNWCFSQTERPKVGLVLSGGGAKGVAHIGVLKAMEKAGLRPDYITGTSMGSIIGGLYAAGYTADELEEMVLGIDWSQLLSDKIPFDQISFPEKEYSSRYLLKFYMEDGKFLLPKGFIEGQPLMEYFNSLTFHVQHIEEFKDLPIPFACVGADIVNGQPILLNSGSLARSMRASMALPSIFAPVKIDDKLLVDGGLLRNMPVDEVLDMGADIVIGVTVADDLEPEEKLNSAFDILVQATFIKSAYDTREQVEKCDYLIRPNLEGFSTGSFSDANKIYLRGMEAGEKIYPTLKKLADSLNQIGPQKKIKNIRKVQSVKLNKIKVQGLENVDSTFVRSYLGIDDNSSVNIKIIEDGVDRIVGSLLFEAVSYEIEPTEQDSIYNMMLILKERPLIELRFSYHYDTDNKGGILLNATFRNLLVKNNRLVLEANLSLFPRVSFDYLQYLNKEQMWGIQLNSYYYYSDIPNINRTGDKNSLLSSNTYSATAKLQNFKINNSAAGIYGRWQYHSLNPKILNEENRFITNVSYSQFEYGLFFSHNSLNSRYFATKGMEIDFKLTYHQPEAAKFELLDSIDVDADILGDLYYDKAIVGAVIDFKPIIPFGKSVSLVNELKFKVSDISNNVLNFSGYDFIGGGNAVYDNTNYYGASAYEYTAYNYFYAYSGLQIELKAKLFATAFYNYLESLQLIEKEGPTENLGALGDRTSRYAYGIEAGYLSPIGPIKLGMAKDHFKDNLRAYFSIGFYY